MKETYAKTFTFTPYKTYFHLVFWEEEWLVGANPSMWNFGSTWPSERKRHFQSIFARSASAVTPSEKRSIVTNRKSITSFSMSLRWTSYVAPKPPKGGSKTHNRRFPCKIALWLKKVCYKISLCENRQRQNCKASTGLSIRVEMIGGDVPLYAKIWQKLTTTPTPVQNADFHSIFAHGA